MGAIVYRHDVNTTPTLPGGIRYEVYAQFYDVAQEGLQNWRSRLLIARLTAQKEQAATCAGQRREAEELLEEWS